MKPSMFAIRCVQPNPRRFDDYITAEYAAPSRLTGFAVNFRKNSPLWDKLLTGRSARLIVTLNTPSWIYRWVFGRPGHNTMKKTILQFCGIKPVRITEVGPMKNSSEAKRKKWLEQVRALGAEQA